MRIDDRNELMMFGVIVAGKPLFGFDCRGATRLGFIRLSGENFRLRD
jgi:hypothetical protein